MTNAEIPHQPGSGPQVERQPEPPAWAQTLLRLLLTPESQESVAGDLLEEYREARRPALGALRADRWYVRQVCGFLWRASLPWGLLLGACIAGRIVWDAYAPPPLDWADRSRFSTYTAIAAYTLAGCAAAWRTRQASTGPVAALAAHAIAHALAIAATLAVFGAILARSDAQRLRVFIETGGFDETLILPIVMVPFVAALGWIGGLFGKSGTRRPTRSARTAPR